MKSKMIYVALAGVLGVSPAVFAQGHKQNDFNFTAQSIESLKLTSLVAVDDTQFVFNNGIISLLCMRQYWKIKKSVFCTGQVIQVSTLKLS